MKIYALIPARKGSKGLPNKCCYPLNQKPLIVHTIEAALQSKKISEIWVSSDSAEIMKITQDYGIHFLERPFDLASDTANSEQVITHFIETRNLPQDAVFILLQPTSPLRTSQQIDEALALFDSKEVRGVISVTEPTVKPLKAFKITQNGYLEGLINNQFPFQRRQDLPSAHYSNGAIYAFYVSDFIEEKKFPMYHVKPYIMDENSSIDIDTRQDIELADKILKGV